MTITPTLLVVAAVWLIGFYQGRSEDESASRSRALGWLNVFIVGIAGAFGLFQTCRTTPKALIEPPPRVIVAPAPSLHIAAPSPLHLQDLRHDRHPSP